MLKILPMQPGRLKFTLFIRLSTSSSIQIGFAPRGI